jgi:hypothetical protein
MSADLKPSLRLSFLTSEALPIPTPLEILARLGRVQCGTLLPVLDHFIATGKQDPVLHWVRIDAFRRETLWEGREGREAWERALVKGRDAAAQGFHLLPDLRVLLAVGFVQ